MKSGEQPHEPASPTHEASSTANEERRALLGPHLAALKGLVAGFAPGDELPATIVLEEASLELSTWERGALSRNPSGVDRDGRVWPSLVFEGVAFRARCGQGTASLDGEQGADSPEQRAGLVEALKLDAAIGVALMQELQWTVEELIRANEFRIVKPVTEFRNALGVRIAEMRKQLGGETFAAAERLAPSFCDPHSTQTAGVEVVEQPEREAPVQFKRDTVATGRIVSRKKAGPNRRMHVLVALLVLSGIGLVAFHVMTGTDYLPPPVLTMENFRHIDAVRVVSARPPSLYVDVDADSWVALRESQRRDLLDDIGSVAAGAGYNGVHARTTAGLVAGQWMKQTGSQVATLATGGT